MNWRHRLILISLIGNLALGMLVWFRSKPIHSAPTASMTSDVLPVNRERWVRITESNSVSVNAPFHWSQVESPDYEAYIANLRSIGCPEETIENIITADVQEMFSVRIKELVAPVSYRFWQLLLKQEEFEKVVTTKMHELEALDDERDALLETLLGTVTGRNANAQMEQLKRQLEFLSEGKLTALYRINLEFQESWNAFGAQYPEASPTERKARETELNAVKEAQLKALLTTEEYAEYRLRTGDAANLRFKFADFEITEEEVRTLAALKSNTATNVNLRDFFGPERYVAYERTLDPKYQQNLGIINRFDLPSTTAVQLFEMRKAAEAQAVEIRSMGNQTATEREALLAAIRAETERSLREVLGPEVFRVYQKHGGSWVPQLGQGKQ